MLLCECEERNGAVLRAVRPLRRTPSEVSRVTELMMQVPNFLPKTSQVGFLTNRRHTFYLVDDVGIIAVVDPKGEAAHCHITFWDGRLRGREKLCFDLAQMHMEAASLEALWTAIPEDRRTVIAFAKRIGFELINIRAGAHVMGIRRR